MPKRKKAKKQFAICPCCGTSRDQTEMKTMMKAQEELDRKLYKHYKQLDINTYMTFLNGGFEWACDWCLKNRNTEWANPLGQLGAWTHHLVYHDTSLNCATCGDDFIFTAQEKKRWYEQYQIWNFIQPKNCPKCRKDVREFKNRNTRLSKLLEQGAEELSSEELHEVIEIYQKWGKEDRVKYYQAQLRKLD